MDQRQYTYQYRKPRLNNPTFLSSNVNNSMSFYIQQDLSKNYLNHYNKNQNIIRDQNKSPQAINSKLINQNISNQITKNKSAVFDGKNNKIQPSRYGQVQQHQMANEQKSFENRGKCKKYFIEANSNLSNYGSNILNGSNFKASLYNDQQVYNKQEKKFNIITMRPKQYDETIKRYPKLTLEDQDVYFYKKLDIIQKSKQKVEKLQSIQKQRMNGHINN